MIGGLTEAGGGVFEFTRGLCGSLRDMGTSVSVLGLECVDEKELSLWQPCKPTCLRSVGPSFLRIPVCLSESLKQTGADVAHVHGLWNGFSQAVPGASARCGIPYIVSTHGMLEPWAWAYHAWKKRPIWWLWERRFLKRAALLHATAESEVIGLRALGLRNPVAVIPPGVNMALKPVSPTFNQGRDKKERLLLFLSRVHPKKGLLNLVKAWSQVRPQGWCVVVAGPDQGGHLAEIQAAVNDAGLKNDFRFLAPVSGDAKWNLLKSADIFVLPTHSENFAIVVIEALACGIPVLTTKGAPWEQLVTRDCGWWVDIGVEPLAAALREATSLSDQQRYEMGQRGRRLVEEKYAWPKIARDLLATYNWVLDGKLGNPPHCVTVRIDE